MTNSITTYNLNISPKYAPSWGTWEVAREVICNAIDACGDEWTSSYDGPHKMSVWTPTCPDLAQMFIMGHGSKGAGENTIGQFGEGLKVAAAVVTRTMDSSMVCYTGHHKVTFLYKEELGQQCLHAQVEDFPCSEGFMVEVCMPNLRAQTAMKFVSPVGGPVRKTEFDKMRIYSKGVYITERNERSLYDWNLNDLRINRDRDVADEYNIRACIARWISECNDQKVFDNLLLNLESYEAKNIPYYFSDSVKPNVVEAFRRNHGVNAITSVGNRSIDSAAEGRGFKVVTVPSAFDSILSGDVKTTLDVAPRNSDLEVLDARDAEKFNKKIETLRTLNALLVCPTFSVRVYKNNHETWMGRADIEDACIYLNETLFCPGSELDLVRTYIHEAAHITSESGDCTLEFENALDAVAGRLAVSVMQENGTWDKLQRG